MRALPLNFREKVFLSLGITLHSACIVSGLARVSPENVAIIFVAGGFFMFLVGYSRYLRTILPPRK